MAAVKCPQRNFAVGVNSIMLRAIKFICAVGLYISALIPGGLAFVFFLELGRPESLWLLCFAAICLALAGSLVWAGSYLFARLDLPISSKAKLLIAGLIFCYILAIALVVPNFVKARYTSAGNACINNLRQIDAAANQFALEKGLTNGQAIRFPNDLTPYIKLNSAGKIPPCQNGGVYHISKVGETPTCSMSTLTPAHVLP
jgi:hypothetical protein